MIDQLQQTLNQTSDIVGGVSPDQYDASTPCPEYDVRTLMNHMVAGNLMFASVANGDELDMSIFGEDHLGEDPAAAYRTSAEAALAAWQRPGALDEQLAFGNLPGSTVIKLHMTEELAHGWDLARATDQSTELDPQLAQTALDTMRAMPEQMMTRSPQGFDEPVDVPADAPPGDQLVAFLGRDPP